MTFDAAAVGAAFQLNQKVATVDWKADKSDLADADEAYAFSGDKATVLKHRDRAPEDVHVTIQRRDATADGLDREDAKMLLAFIDGDVDGGGLDELGTIHKLRDLAEEG
jgi:hypothetical protein